MSESRNELLAWYNDLSQSSFTKIEQFGTGSGLCVIFDSIFRDIPLLRVKLNAKSEWEFVSNFKILQSAFDKHKIDNYIPVERLIKCKFQDNLEFLQWVKKFWDQYYPGGTYEPRVSVTQLPNKPASQAKLMGSPAVIKKAISKNTVKQAATAAGPGRSLSDEYLKVANDLNTQVADLKQTVDQAEKEREFYFAKLREIEVYIQSVYDSGCGDEMESTLKNIQEIMYKTEDGFEVPVDSAEVEV